MAEGSAEQREAGDGTVESGGLALPSSSDVMWSSGRKSKVSPQMKKVLSKKLWDSQ